MMTIGKTLGLNFLVKLIKSNMPKSLLKSLRELQPVLALILIIQVKKVIGRVTFQLVDGVQKIWIPAIRNLSGNLKGNHMQRENQDNNLNHQEDKTIPQNDRANNREIL